MYKIFWEDFTTNPLSFFLFGHSDRADIFGWHLSLLITAIISWQLAKVWYHRNDKK